MSEFKPITTQDQLNDLIAARIRRERKRICTQVAKDLKAIYMCDGWTDMQIQMVKLIDKLNNPQNGFKDT